MLFFVGLGIVIFSVIFGYTAHGGQLGILYQPMEVLIIVGSAVGAQIIGNPKEILSDTVKSLKYLFKGKPYAKAHYSELLGFFFKVFKLIKTKGLLEIESHIENPHESELFKGAPSILSNHVVVDFICDYLRLITMGVENPHMFEDLIDKEVEIYEHEMSIPGGVMNNFGESLPALGIVAAVLGVINTMKSITEPPEVLGGLIAAALVGTFLGVLLSYSIFGPMGSFLTKFGHAQGVYLKCIKAGFISHLQGNAPTVTVEFMRKIIPEHERPTFKEADAAINGAPAG
jgi:chemotaxis protein MotA